MKLTTYSYWIDGPSDGPSVYTFATAEARAAALRDHLKQIFESEDLGEVEDLGETPDEDAIEQALDDAGWTYGLDECVTEVPILHEITGHLQKITDLAGHRAQYPSHYHVLDLCNDEATTALNKLNSIKS